MLQWGRGEIPRKGVGCWELTPTTTVLQWGRGEIPRKGYRSAAPSSRNARFNGAAVRYRGKGNIARRYIHSRGCFNGAAVRYRGKVGSYARPGRTTGCFNGAAVRYRGKETLRAVHPMALQALQWGRGEIPRKGGSSCFAATCV